MPFAQSLFERRVEIGRTRVLAFFKIARQQRLVLLHQLVDQFAVGVGDRVEVRVAAVVLEHFDHVPAAMRRQVEQQALLAEALADLGHQAGQVDIVGVDLVDHDHARQAARLRRPHHALGGEFDAGLGVDHHDGGFDAGQRGDGLSGEIGVARGVDEVDVYAFPCEVDQRRVQRMPGRFFLGVEVADGAALLDAAPGGDGAGMEQQGFRQRGLAGTAVADKGQGADGFGGVAGHDANSIFA